jgi:hypothetical protein
MGGVEVKLEGGNESDDGMEWDKDEANEIILLGETFTTFSAAQTRSCNNQHNACADIANSNTVCSFLPPLDIWYGKWEERCVGMWFRWGSVGRRGEEKADM